MSKQVCFEMMTDRGYVVHDHDDAFICAQKPDGAFVRLFFVHEETVNVEYLGTLYKKAKAGGWTHIILVHATRVTNSAKKLLKDIDFRVETFKQSELQFNVTRHVLVPPHTRVPSVEHPERAQYPVLKASDPVARFLGFRKGEVVRVDRADEPPAFRIVQ